MDATLAVVLILVLGPSAVVLVLAAIICAWTADRPQKRRKDD